MARRVYKRDRIGRFARTGRALNPRKPGLSARGARRQKKRNARATAQLDAKSLVLHGVAYQATLDPTELRAITKSYQASNRALKKQLEKANKITDARVRQRTEYLNGRKIKKGRA